MKHPAFAYARPASLADALELLAGGDDAKVLAGGQSLLPAHPFDVACAQAYAPASRPNRDGRGGANWDR